MLIKICGIKDIDSAYEAVEAGAKALGFVFAPSSREVCPENAKEIIKTLPNDVLKIGVFVNASIFLVKEIVEYCNLTTLQFHGNESVDYCQQFKRQVIKAIKVAEDGRLFPDPARYKGVIKVFLADTYQPGADGGTGKSFPWKEVETIKRCGLVILAGGLNSNNIYRALSIARPWGVDVSSGVETKGHKDSKKIKKFIQEVWRWKNEQNITR